MDNESLIQKCVLRDLSAWKEFTEMHTGLIRRSITYKIRNLGIPLPEIDINDIAQEIFLSIWENNRLSEIKKAGSVRGWLAIISINTTTNYCRRFVFRKNKRISSLDSPIKDTAMTLSDILPDTNNPAEKAIAFNELKALVDKEISKMPKREQLAVKFSLYDGHKQKDIAKILNVPESTIANHISQAKSKLKDVVKKYWIDDPVS
ncbi:MAG: sigma-70 family RNA polymerase sigma factor [Candidatus Aadella gelida]|nr:sigma-70 family RNA polymerase sigma factor [Candidatus Aadella gelida]